MLAAVLISFLGAILARFIVGRTFPHGGWVASLLPAGLFVFFLVKGVSLPETGVIIETLEWVPALGISLSFRLDGFALLFVLLITGIGTLVTIYAGAYFSHSPREEGARFLTLILLFMTAMLGTVLSDNLIVMFVFWEATSLLSFMLQRATRLQRAARHVPAAEQHVLEEKTEECRSEERRVGKECRSRWSPYH